jgi:acyl dehydratase
MGFLLHADMSCLKVGKSMDDESILLSRLQNLIGHEFCHTDEFEVEKGMIKRFAIALDDPNPLYFDQAFACKTPYGGIVAPPTFLFEWNHHAHWHPALSPEARSSLFEGLNRQPRFLRAGNELDISQPPRPGDVIHSRARITDVYAKQGKSGQLIFVICETDYFNQKDEALGKNKDTFVMIP